MATADYRQIINISTRLRRDGNLTVTSPDLPGLFLAGKNLLALTKDLPQAIKALYRLNYGMEVEVELRSGMQPVDDGMELTGPLSYAYKQVEDNDCRMG